MLLRLTLKRAYAPSPSLTALKNKSRMNIHGALLKTVAQNRPARLHFFETPSATEWGYPVEGDQFVPTRFVDIGSTLERKLEAMAKYESELRPAPHPRSLESLRSRAAYWGQVIHRPYAEAFVVGREIE